MNLKTISTTTAEHYAWGEKCHGWFLLKADDIHVIQERMPPGSAEIMHFHSRARQLFYVLRGTLTMAGAAGSLAVSAGHAVVIEPNFSHRAENNGAEDVEFLVISCPPSHQNRFDGGTARP